MNKCRLRIKECEDSNGYTIYFDCIGLDKDYYSKIKDIIRRFATGDKIFFGHYKTDGMNIPIEVFKKYETEIPEYFKNNGRYEKIIKGEEKRFLFISSPPLEFTVCNAPLNNETFEIMEKIFHYYLETTVFCPKIDWKTFVSEYSNYMSNGSRDYVAKGYTDFLFSYVDSGDFSITFDSKMHDPLTVKNDIFKILELDKDSNL